MKEFQLFVGIDVSKERLDVAVRPTGETWQVPYDAEGIRSLAGCLRELAPHLRWCWKPPVAWNWPWLENWQQPSCL